MRASKYAIENRDYNIITCVNFNQQHTSLPPVRKLGQSQDHPYPRKAKFELMQDQYNSSKPENQELIKPASLMNASSVKFNFISFTQAKAAPIHEIKEDLKIIHKKKVV